MCLVCPHSLDDLSCLSFDLFLGLKCFLLLGSLELSDCVEELHHALGGYDLELPLVFLIVHGGDVPTHKSDLFLSCSLFPQLGFHTQLL